MSADRLRLDLLSTRYNDLKYAIPAVSIFNVTDSFEANLPGLAFHLWGEAGYWWVLAMYNGIVDPIDDVTTGIQLRIPDIERVKIYLQTIPDEGVLPTNVIII